MEKVLGKLDKSDSGCIEIAFKEAGGNTFLDIRKMYKKKDMDDYAPTRKGIFVPVAKLKALHRAIGKAIKIAEKAGLLEADSDV